METVPCGSHFDNRINRAVRNATLVLGFSAMGCMVPSAAPPVQVVSPEPPPSSEPAAPVAEHRAHAPVAPGERLRRQTERGQASLELRQQVGERIHAGSAAEAKTGVRVLFRAVIPRQPAPGIRKRTLTPVF
jgi:hypothetical protein